MSNKIARIDGAELRPKIYLAGPDVFLDNPAPVYREKKQILDNLGLDGYVPTDNDISLNDSHPSGQAIATAIARANFEMMGWCDSCIAQLTPFRGPSADVGTVGEVHYMYALAKPVFAYSNDSRDLQTRVVEAYYSGNVIHGHDEMFDRPILSGRDGLFIENYGQFDNLMIPYAISDSGGSMHVCDAPDEQCYTDLTAFRNAARAAAIYFYGEEQIAQLEARG